MIILSQKNWRTAQIPDGLAIEIEKFLKTDVAHQMGINTISGFIAHCLRVHLDELQGKIKNS